MSADPMQEQTRLSGPNAPAGVAGARLGRSISPFAEEGAQEASSLPGLFLHRGTECPGELVHRPASLGQVTLEAMHHRRLDGRRKTEALLGFVQPDGSLGEELLEQLSRAL